MWVLRPGYGWSPSVLEFNVIIKTIKVSYIVLEFNVIIQTIKGDFYDYLNQIC